MTLPELFAVIVQVPVVRIVRDPEDGFTVQTVGDDEPKTIVPIFSGEVYALTEYVPAGSPNTTTGLLPKAKFNGATRFTVDEFEE